MLFTLTERELKLDKKINDLYYIDSPFKILFSRSLS